MSSEKGTSSSSSGSVSGSGSGNNYGSGVSVHGSGTYTPPKPKKPKWTSATAGGTTSQTQAGIDYVKDKLGLTATIANPNEAATQSNTTGYYSTTGNQMYGGAASQATNEYLVSIGEATQNPSGSYTLTAKGWKMKYGSYTPGQAQTGAAMGTGNPAGIMTSTPISKPMWKQQQKTKAILLGGLSFMTGGGLSSMALRAGAFDAINKSGQAGYSEYLSKFYTSQGKDVSSSGIKSGNVDTSGSEVSSSGIINTSVTDNQNIDVAGSFKKKKAGQGADQIAGDRSLFATTNKTITGAMV